MRVLQAIIDDYIATAEPVGSRTIARKYDLGVSPATIRNEMSDLEESGYLAQPHTSAGRIPSDKGYRFYVDVLMDPADMTDDELEHVRENMSANQRAVSSLIHRAAKTLSELSRYTALVMAPRISETVIRRVQLTPLDEHHFLMVIVTDPGFVQNQIVGSTHPIDELALIRLSDQLNRVLVGKSIKDITNTMLSSLQDSFGRYSFFDETMELLLRAIQDGAGEKVYLDGTIHLFEQPEFQDVERAKVLLGFLGEQESVASLFGGLSTGTSIQVTIGKEHTHAEMQQCSMVAATYSIGGSVSGAVGVVGPTRLDYAKVVGVVRGLADSLSEVLSHMTYKV